MEKGGGVARKSLPPGKLASGQEPGREGGVIMIEMTIIKKNWDSVSNAWSE